MTHPKFIITAEGIFRMGMVTMHEDLLIPGDDCLGGGYYYIDYPGNRIILDRSSYDFGAPRWHLLQKLRVPSAYQGMSIVYRYNDRYHEDFNVSEELIIEYYD